MTAPSVTDSAEALREEIRQLESALNVIDDQLVETSHRLEVLDAKPAALADSGSLVDLGDEVPEEDAWLAAATAESLRRSEAQERQLTSDLRSGATAVPSLSGQANGDGPKSAQDAARVPRTEAKGETVFPVLKRWVGVTLGAGVVAALWFAVIRPSHGDGDASRTTTPEELEAYAAELQADLDQAENALRQFYRSDSLGDLLPRVRMPEVVAPIIQAHHESAPLIATEIEILGEMKRVEKEGETFVVAQVRHPGTPREGREVAVQLSATGAKIDWEMAANAQRETWETLPRSMEGQTESSPFRVSLAEGAYYDGDYPEDNWICFRVTAPGVDKPGYAYAPRQSAMADRLKELVETTFPEPVQVVASFTPGQSTDVVRQLRVLELFSDGWLMADAELPLTEPRVAHRFVSSH